MRESEMIGKYGPWFKEFYDGYYDQREDLEPMDPDDFYNMICSQYEFAPEYFNRDDEFMHMTLQEYNELRTTEVYGTDK